MTPWRAADRWMFAPGSSGQLAGARSALACVLAVRIALGPFRHLDPQLGDLFRPPPFLAWLHTIPAPPWIVSLQVLGVAAALAAAAGWRPRSSLIVAWACLLTLAGLKGSYGKILHNDVLLILAAIPLLAAPVDGRHGDATPSRRFGWPVRTSVVVIATVYAASGVQKLAYSGIEWVTGDNMRWVLYQAAAGGRVRWPAVPRAIADTPWLTHVLAAILLAGELLAPLLIVPQRTRPLFVAYALSLHAGTWLMLGLDYWAWALTVVALLVPWDPLTANDYARRPTGSRVTGWGRVYAGLRSRDPT